MAAKVKRNVLLINRPFQLKFSFFVTSWLFPLSILFPFVCYNLFSFVVGTDPSAVEQMKEARFQLLSRLVLLEIVFIAVTFLISLFISHKIAGPLYKLRLAMQEASAGNWRGELKFRKGDNFPEMAEEYNLLVASARKRLGFQSEMIAACLARMEASLPKLEGEGRKEIEKAIEELRKARDQAPA